MRIGVGPDEFVLRGGFLPGPVVLESIEVVDGILFVQLLKTSNWINRFLAGAVASKRLLARSLTIERLATARNEKRQELRSGLLRPGEAKLDEEKEDDENKENLLDLYAETSVQDTADTAATTIHHANLNRTKRTKLKAQMPKTVTLTVERSDFESWSVKVLLADKHGVSMEASQSNFDRLFQHVRADLAEGTHKRAKNGELSGDRPAPKGPKGSREYWTSSRERWRKKIVAQPDGHQTSILDAFGSGAVVPFVEGDRPRSKAPSGRKVRTLSRVATDASEPKRTRKKRSAAKDPSQGESATPVLQDAYDPMLG